MCKYFTIYGERCSGTNYLEQLMVENFNIEVDWKYNWKHFFGFYDFKHTVEEDETLFIGIVRDPLHWLYSLYLNKHHFPNELHILQNFLTHEFYSLNNDNSLNTTDLNYITHQKYKTIFELRKLKNDFLMTIMPKKVKNYILIRYEDLRDNNTQILYLIKSRFNLTNKYTIYKNISYYKNYKNIEYKKHSNEHMMSFNHDVIKFIINNLNHQQEHNLGYLKNTEKILKKKKFTMAFK